MVPAIRIQACNTAPVRADGDYVLYWIIAFRRTAWNFSLQRAVEWAVKLRRPLVVFEPLRVGYRWASDRLHRFVIDGMADNAAQFAQAKNSGVLYVPYLEPMPDAGKGQFNALAQRACIVVTDDYPSSFLPRMVQAAAGRLDVHLEKVDSNGLLPLRATDRVFTTAYSCRAFLQKELPDADACSGLSPYLHFGHISSHRMFHELMRQEHWSPEKLGTKTRGQRKGWWGLCPGAEAWLDQFVTWRELGYNMASHRGDYDQYESLPDWALTTLKRHAADRREHLYTLDQFAAAATHDPLWNAAQTQLLREGHIHNYLRMLWGKKVLEWTTSPQEALDVMIELNNRFALDGRDPISYSGIFWVLGRYDRAWGPERPVFGKDRYMTSQNTRRKLRIKRHLDIYG